MKKLVLVLTFVCVFPCVLALNGFTQAKAPTSNQNPNPANRVARNSPAVPSLDDTRGTVIEGGGVDSARPIVGPEFIIGAEDVLGIYVWHEPDFTRKVFVRPDGKIGVPFLRDIQAAGLTTSQLADRIKEEAKRLLSDPEVSVTIEEIHSQVVNLLGAVGRPGIYPLGAPMTIIDLIARAGGLTEYAKKDDILVIRQELPFKSSRYIFKYNEFVNNRNYPQNWMLKNRDTVIIPD
jgi:polysaccharide biosynthesis/export protein